MYDFKYNTRKQSAALEVCKLRGGGVLFPCRKCIYNGKKRLCPKLRQKGR